MQTALACKAGENTVDLFREMMRAMYELSMQEWDQEFLDEFHALAGSVIAVIGIPNPETSQLEGRRQRRMAATAHASLRRSNDHTLY